MARKENIFSNLSKDFIKELEAVVQAVMIENGVRKDSDLVKSVEFSTQSRDSLYMLVNDYYQDVSKGRKPNTKKIPIFKLIAFIKKKGIVPKGKKTIGQLAFQIQRSIYLNGIKSRNFISTVENTVGNLVEIRIADFLEEYVADMLAASISIGSKKIVLK